MQSEGHATVPTCTQGVLCACFLRCACPHLDCALWGSAGLGGARVDQRCTCRPALYLARRATSFACPPPVFTEPVVSAGLSGEASGRGCFCAHRPGRMNCGWSRARHPTAPASQSVPDRAGRDGLVALPVLGVGTRGVLRRVGHGDCCLLIESVSLRPPGVSAPRRAFFVDALPKTLHNPTVFCGSEQGCTLHILTQHIGFSQIAAQRCPPQ